MVLTGCDALPKIPNRWTGLCIKPNVGDKAILPKPVNRVPAAGLRGADFHHTPTSTCDLHIFVIEMWNRLLRLGVGIPT